MSSSNGYPQPGLIYPASDLGQPIMVDSYGQPIMYTTDNGGTFARESGEMGQLSTGHLVASGQPHNSSRYNGTSSGVNTVIDSRSNSKGTSSSSSSSSLGKQQNSVQHDSELDSSSGSVKSKGSYNDSSEQNHSDHSSCGKTSTGSSSVVSGDKKDGAVEEEEDHCNSMEVGSDGDSGCPSECTDLSPVSGSESTFPPTELNGDASTAALNGDATATADGSKPRGKRRYYMYGNHKLVKPIKEIPLRFQMLLAEASAAKARCEGQPIYMQQPPQQPVYDMVYYPAAGDGSQATLNANATCFVPSQGGDPTAMQAYMPECYTICPTTGYPISASAVTNHSGLPSTNLQTNPASSLQPTPLFIPPNPQGPSNSSSPSQMCQTIIVYSSAPSNTALSQGTTSIGAQPVRSIPVPPPPFPPPASRLPPHLEQMSTNSSTSMSSAVNQVVFSVPANLAQNKPDSKSSYQTSNKQPPTILNMPPPNCVQAPPPHLSNGASHIPQSPVAPPPTGVQYSNAPTVLTMPQVVNMPQALPPSSAMAPTHVPPPGITMSSSSSLPTVSYDGSSSGQQYMYIYPSAPTGHTASPPQVMYMVSPTYPSNPAYQQTTGVLVPSSCPVPVQ